MKKSLPILEVIQMAYDKACEDEGFAIDNGDSINVTLEQEKQQTLLIMLAKAKKGKLVFQYIEG